MSGWSSRTKRKSARSEDPSRIMKLRNSRVSGDQQVGGVGGLSGGTNSRNKGDSLVLAGAASGGGSGAGIGGGGVGLAGSSRESRNAGQLAAANQQQSSAQARKRRSSINVYDQPSSLNSRLRQLETDMLRLDEDRSKLHDDTHAVLAQYELRLSEVHAILKSRQDNVDKYVEDMRSLVQAKEDFEKQTKLLNEKHDRIHEKFMHRETTISREIKLLKNKFELLEKSRQFRSILQKSNSGAVSGDLAAGLDDGLALSSSINEPHRSEADSYPADRNHSSAGLGEVLAESAPASASQRQRQHQANKKKSVHIKLSKLHTIGRLIAPLFNINKSSNRMKRRRSNRVSSVLLSEANNALGGKTIIVDAANAAAADSAGQLEGSDRIEPSETLGDGAPRYPSAAGRKKRGLFQRIMFIR